MLCGETHSFIYLLQKWHYFVCLTCYVTCCRIAYRTKRSGLLVHPDALWLPGGTGKQYCLNRNWWYIIHFHVDLFRTNKFDKNIVGPKVNFSLFHKTLNVFTPVSKFTDWAICSKFLPYLFLAVTFTVLMLLCYCSLHWQISGSITPLIHP
jgi:hypothetical protein